MLKEQESPSKKRLKQVETCCDEVLYSTIGNIRAISSLLEDRTVGINSVTSLLKRQEEDSKVKIRELKEAASAAIASLELQLKGKCLSIEILQKKLKEVEKKNDELEEGMMSLSTKIAELQEEKGKSSTSAMGEREISNADDDNEKGNSSTSAMGETETSNADEDN